MMTDTEALQAILKRIGEFSGMPKEHIRTENHPIFEGKPFTAPDNEIWAQVSINGAGRFISGLADKPCTRTTGVVFVQLFAPLNTGVIKVSQLADLWADHLQFYSYEHLELKVSSIIHPKTNPDFYQVNVNTPFTIN